jgi:hypothetical protein
LAKAAKSAFKSENAKSFNKKKAPPPVRVVAEDEIKPSKLPMEMKTTNRDDFIPWEVEQAEKPTEALPPQPQIPFAGRSEYHKEYPHWGDYRAIPGKPM